MKAIGNMDEAFKCSSSLLYFLESNKYFAVFYTLVFIQMTDAELPLAWHSVTYKTFQKLSLDL